MNQRNKNLDKNNNDKNKSNAILNSGIQQDMSQLFFCFKRRTLKFYVNVLNEKVFEDAIIKFKLLDENDYLSKDEYNEAIIKFASLIKIKTDFTSNQTSNQKKTNQKKSSFISNC